MFSTRLVGAWEEVLADLRRQKEEDKNANGMQFSGPEPGVLNRNWPDRAREVEAECEDWKPKDYELGFR